MDLFLLFITVLSKDKDKSKTHLRPVIMKYATTTYSSDGSRHLNVHRHMRTTTPVELIVRGSLLRSVKETEEAHYVGSCCL